MFVLLHKMSLVRLLRLASCFAALLAVEVRSSRASNHNNARDALSDVADLSVHDILEKAITSMGGRDALVSMKAVSSHALWVWKGSTQDHIFNVGIASTELSV